MANALFTMADVEIAHFAEPDVRTSIEYIPPTFHYKPGEVSGVYDKYSYTPGGYTTRTHYRRTPSGYVGIREVWRSSSPKKKAVIVGATALTAAGSYLLSRQIFKTIAAGAEKQQQKQKRSR